MPCDHRLGFHNAKSRSPVRPNTEEPDPEDPVGDRQLQPLFLFLALEDEQLMTQGKDFCLERNSCTQGIAQDSEQGNKGRHHRPEAYRCPALSAITTARTEFLLGTGFTPALCKRLFATTISCSPVQFLRLCWLAPFPEFCNTYLLTF
jgi:hypothetical protein